jgi:hypothetical protein
VEVILNYFLKHKKWPEFLPTISGYIASILLFFTSKIVSYFPQKEKTRIIITSGASCPDAVVDAVVVKLLELNGITPDFENLILG